MVAVRLCYFGGTPQPVMCGVMVLSCMRCGVLERGPSETKTTVKLDDVVHIKCCQRTNYNR